MYAASNAFHEAVADGEPQMALLIFDDAVFTNDDIDVEKGIEFNDYFNAEEDLSIGQALSNELSFAIFNDEGLLDNYEFGDFLATIGVKIDSTTVSEAGVVQASSTSHTYVAYTSSPYLKRDGVAVSSQPASIVKSILIYDGKVYCKLANDTIKVYKDSNGTEQSYTANNFMLAQMDKWAGKGIFYNKSTRILQEWEGTTLDTYEFVPLGYFTAERPNIPAVNEINFTCYDYMQKFEPDMPSDSELNISYPITIGNLFVAMCNYAGVQYRTSTFINSTATISKRLDDFDSVTMRDVLQWIAEAAGSNARFDRDGYLIMDWLRTTQQQFDENNYVEFNPYWYKTKQIQQLQNKASNGEYKYIRGSTGNVNGYLIQDNPLLKGVE